MIFSEELRLITGERNIREALSFIESNEPKVINKQVSLCEIAAPTFQENMRAQEFVSMFKEIGANGIEIDGVGNVIVERKGIVGGPPLVLAAHLDTVFPEGTDVKVRRRGNIFQAPGIGDNSRGLAVLLGIYEAMERFNIRTKSDVIFLGDVGEEGLGNLGGIQFFLEHFTGLQSFISFDGSGNETICFLGLSSNRYQVSYSGLGGHAFNNFGTPSAINVLGKGIAKIADLKLPKKNPIAIINIGLIKGGSAVNAIAEYAEMCVDIRSSCPEYLKSLSDKFLSSLERVLDQVNQKGQDKLSMDWELIGCRPGGKQRRNSTIVRNAVEVTRFLGLDPILQGYKSTSANLPMSLGIPSLTLGSGVTDTHIIQLKGHPDSRTWIHS